MGCRVRGSMKGRWVNDLFSKRIGLRILILYLWFQMSGQLIKVETKWEKYMELVLSKPRFPHNHKDVCFLTQKVTCLIACDNTTDNQAIGCHDQAILAVGT